METENNYSESVIDAQREAEKQAEEILNSNEEDESLPEVPRLLQLPQADLIKKTHELKSKGNQLDLLLLKAESYSHFIAENQKRSKIKLKSYASEIQKKNNSSSASKNKPSKRSHSPQTDDNVIKEAVSEFQPPNLVGGTLLPYQLEGLQWLLSLWENGLSGILADEMGLGKTIQVIALIAHLRYCNTPGPYLIACPLAVIANWVNEIKKWLPSCPVVMYHGNKSEREEIRQKHMPVSKSKDLSFPIVVTSFEICIIDRSHLQRFNWQYLILDEGHRIKNRNCRLVRELKQIPSISRLLLSGTPIQNTLEELWSLLNFCAPMIFDDLRVFQAWFGFRNIGTETSVEDIIGNEQQDRIVTKLHEILRPFLLRRLKRDVMIKIPPKVEVVVYCHMSSLQRDYYVHVLQGTIRETLLDIGVEKAKELSQDNMMMNLRKVCNHPFLFGEPRDVSGRFYGEANPELLALASGKFRLLDRMLPKLKERGHKVLIFSQMTKLLDILEDYLSIYQYKFCRIDGSCKVNHRQSSIDRFNSDPSYFVFLLSTRAGGLGINLTSADTCILFDSDWNPHQDSQAQDRCHRIGQTRPVIVYRLLTAGSIEIEVMEKQISKKKLERLTIHGGDFRRAGHRLGSQLTLSNLRKLLDDDVKNLKRMIRNPSNAKTLTSYFNNFQIENNDQSEGNTSTATLSTLDDGSSASCDISPSDRPSPGSQKSRRGSKKSSCRSSSSSVNNEESADGPVSTISFDEITDRELDIIMNREKIFSAFEVVKNEVAPLDAEGMSSKRPCSDVETIPIEGEMYDIITSTESQSGVLMALS